ncbi:MAG: P1 family peptidase, partial [Planctomycetota bacterium]
LLRATAFRQGVACNHGDRRELLIAGVPVGRELKTAAVHPAGDDGSIIVILATDAPLLPTQLRRVARRITLGLAHCGSYSGTESGDLFLAFSTREPDRSSARELALPFVPEERIDPLFLATVRATEEAIINALVAAKTMTGFRGRTIEALPHDRLQELLRRHGRLKESAHEER